MILPRGIQIKVLIADGSATARRALEGILASDPDIRVIAAASDLSTAAEKIAKMPPDVLVLDAEMPQKDGLADLKKILSHHPIPVVISSGLAGNGSETTRKALEYGAVGFITRPAAGSTRLREEARIRICDAIKAAARVERNRSYEFREVQPKRSADAILGKPDPGAVIQTTDKIVVAGASTGGTEALRVFLKAMPPDAPGIVIVQHMPEFFTASFAKQLDGVCQVSVKEATNNDIVSRGQVLIAPGNHHLLLKRSGARYFTEIVDGPLVNRHRPSVDVLFRSAAHCAGRNAIGVIMTGMGDDGARGMRELKDAGAFTIAQDEATSVVFGMPREAIKLEAVDRVLPLPAIAGMVLRESTGIHSPGTEDRP